jgi:hypothetical protein
MIRKAAEGSNDDAELREAFQIFDTKNNGYITLMDLKDVMVSLGEKLSDVELEDMIKEADANKDGKIQFEGEYMHVPCHLDSSITFTAIAILRARSLCTKPETTRDLVEWLFVGISGF